MSDIKKIALEDKLYTNEYRLDKVSHLVITDTNACLECATKPCTLVCPARTYTWSDEGEKIIINFENCLECGACRAACPPSVIAWRYPMGGLGVCYRYG